MHGNLYVCKTEKQITHTIQHIKDFECDDFYAKKPFTRNQHDFIRTEDTNFMNRKYKLLKQVQKIHDVSYGNFNHTNINSFV